MRKSLAAPLILILGGIVAAQVPASSPSSAPSTDPAPQTAPVAGPVTLPATETTTEPATQAAVGPTTVAASEPTTGPASTAPSGFATSGPSSRPYGSSYSYNSFSSSRNGRRDSFRSNSPPTTGPGSSGLDFKPKPYPRQYSAMLSRSIFLKGSQRVIDIGSLVEKEEQQGHNPPPAPVPPRTTFSNEGNLVFNGATDADGKMVAFIENTGMNQIARYHVGDAVGQGTTGRITAITLDSLNYTRGTQVTHVNLGQNLNGQDVQVITTQPVVEVNTASGAPSTSQPSSSSGESAGLSDVERRMRERRMKELSQ